MTANPAQAQVLYETTVIEQWDEAAGRWVEITGAERLVAMRAKPQDRAIATYGPFRAIGGNRAQLVGTTDATSPAQFAQLLRDFPGVHTLELVDVAGTRDDAANMQVGRMIRAAGIETLVPAHGSVRSGGVELFLAGAQRSIEDGAEFAVHSWLDTRGLQPQDYSMEHEANRIYLDYYREMGMDSATAHAFYAMTNSVPHHRSLWLDAPDMRQWIAPTEKDVIPQLEYAQFDGRTESGIAALAGASQLDSRVALP